MRQELIRSLCTNEAAKDLLQDQLHAQRKRDDFDRREKARENVQLLSQITELRHYNKMLQTQVDAGHFEVSTLKGKLEAAARAAHEHAHHGAHHAHGHGHGGHALSPHGSGSLGRSTPPRTPGGGAPAAAAAGGGARASPARGATGASPAAGHPAPVPSPAGNSRPASAHEEPPGLPTEQPASYTMGSIRGAATQRPTGAGGLGLGVLTADERRVSAATSPRAR